MTLEDKNLVIETINEVDDKSSRKIYSITEKGKSIFLLKIKELMSKKDREIHTFDLALANIHFLSEE